MTTAFRPLASAVAVAILSVVLWDVYPHTELPCDPLKPDCPPFSETYFHARQAFRNAAASAGAAQESLLVYTDPASGLDYTMDVAILSASSSDSPSEAGAKSPPTETPLLMHMSGVHGVEGFAGSAVQVAALREFATSGGALNQSRPYTTCFVHAVNPYGFANLRRFNENNVDLNRNNLTPEQWKQALARPPNFARYQDFNEVFNPPTVPQWHDRYTVLLRAAAALSVNGFAALKRAIVTGQYHKPSGVYFGGRGPDKEASLRVLQAFVARTFPSPSQVVTLDVHTGLGPTGMDSMMVSSEQTRARAAAVFKTAYTVESPLSAGSNAASGYQDALGVSVLRGTWPHVKDVLDVTQEFGTVAGIFVARATILENAAYQNAPGSPQHAATRAMLKDVFMVPTAAWKRSVVERGLAAFKEAANHLSGR